MDNPFVRVNAAPGDRCWYRRHALTQRCLILVIAASSSVACSEVAPEWSGTVEDSAGVAMVRNTDAGIWAPGGEWTFEEELRIGALDGPEQYVFGDVGGIAVDSRGRVFVLDSHAQQVQVYSAEGIFEGTVGGRGAGPGELELAWAPLMGPGDTLVVPDGRLQRLNLYAPDGSSEGSLRWDVERGRTMAFRTSPAGVIAEQIRPVWDPTEPPTPGENPTDIIVLRALDGTAVDTLLEFPSGQMVGPGGVRVFAPEPRWDIADDRRLLFGAGDRYRVHAYAGGRLARVITKPFDPRPVDDHEKEAIMGEMERRWEEARVPDQMRALLRSRWSFADHYPAFQDLAFGPVGTVWVQRVKPASELDETELRAWQDARSPEWDVFDAQGRFLGLVTLPQRFRLLEIRGDKLYGVSLGDVDESYVVRLGVVGDL